MRSLQVGYAGTPCVFDVPKQTKKPCGLNPCTGVNRWLRLSLSNTAIPEAGTKTGAGAVPGSQSTDALQWGSVTATPSHCSTNTCCPGAKPPTEIVNGAS